LFRIGHVRFRCGEDHRLEFESGAEAFELVHDDADVFHGIGAAARIGYVDEVHEHLGALDVLEELRPEARAFTGAFDQSGDVGDHKRNLLIEFADGNDAEVWLERGEGIVGDLGTRCRDTRDQGRFADVWIADQSDVGEQFEFQAENAFLTDASGLGAAGRLVGGGLELGVAATATAAASNDHALIGTAEIVNDFPGCVVVNDGADGNFEDDVRAFAAGAIRAFAVASALGVVFGVEAEVDERVVALAGFHDDVAAASAVSAAGASAGHEFLATKRHTAVAAVPGFYADFSFIDEHVLQVISYRLWVVNLSVHQFVSRSSSNDLLVGCQLYVGLASHVTGTSVTIISAGQLS